MSNEDKPVQLVAGELPPLPAGYSITRVEGHGWYIDPPLGGRWVAHEGTPAADLIAALRQPVQQPAPTYERKTVSIPNERGPFNPLDTRVSTADQFTEITVQVQQPAAVVGQPLAFMTQHAVEALRAGRPVTGDHSIVQRAPWTVPIYTADVPAAGVQGDVERQAYEAMKLERDVYKHRAEKAEASQPDSGRDAALVAYAKGIEDAANVVKPFAGRVIDARETLAAIRALAAHPAPSNDAELIGYVEKSDLDWLKRQVIGPHGGASIKLFRGKALKEAVAIHAVAHPANGAQAGLSDTERMDFLVQHVVDVRKELRYGSRLLFTSQVRYDDEEFIGTTLREQVDTAILAAAKKG